MIGLGPDYHPNPNLLLSHIKIRCSFTFLQSSPSTCYESHHRTTVQDRLVYFEHLISSTPIAFKLMAPFACATTRSPSHYTQLSTPEELSKLMTLVIACECRDRAKRQNQLQRLSGYLYTKLGHTSDLRKLAFKCGVCDLLQNRRGCSLTSKSMESRKPHDCVRTTAQHCRKLQ